MIATVVSYLLSLPLEIIVGITSPGKQKLIITSWIKGSTIDWYIMALTSKSPLIVQSATQFISWFVAIFPSLVIGLPAAYVFIQETNLKGKKLLKDFFLFQQWFQG